MASDTAFIDGHIYNIGSFIGKTVITARSVPAYRNTSGASVGSYARGTALKVASYLLPNLALNRPDPWFEFYSTTPTNAQASVFIPVIKGYFNVGVFEESGIKTALKESEIALSKSNDADGIGGGSDADGLALSVDDYVKKYGLLLVGVLVGLIAVKTIFNKLF